jgi:hypothetical protein
MGKSGDDTLADANKIANDLAAGAKEITNDSTINTNIDVSGGLSPIGGE